MSDDLRGFVARAKAWFAADARFAGLLGAGSAIGGQTDRWSDLDLVVVVAPDAYDDVMRQRATIAEALGPLRYAFTGEHVGEPRLLICVYAGPVLHVDLKFVTTAELAQRVETPVVLYDRDGDLPAVLAAGVACWPNADAAWFEQRAWVWLHYAATKLGRGELLEVIDMLAFFRGRVLGPMALRRAGADQRGVRRLEQVAPDAAAKLAETIGAFSAAACAAALRRAVELYVEYRADQLPPGFQPEREREVRAWIDEAIAAQAPA